MHWSSTIDALIKALSTVIFNYWDMVRPTVEAARSCVRRIIFLTGKVLRWKLYLQDNSTYAMFLESRSSDGHIQWSGDGKEKAICV